MRPREFFSLEKGLKDGRVSPAGQWKTLEITAMLRMKLICGLAILLELGPQPPWYFQANFMPKNEILSPQI